jgi:hypothetical protein
VEELKKLDKISILLVAGMLMTVNMSVFPSLQAVVIPHQDADYVVDIFGYNHTVWPQMANVSYGDENITIENFEIFYENNISEMNQSGIFPKRITYTPADSVDPQIDINYNNWIIYVVWIELIEGFDYGGFYGTTNTLFMYSGSQNNGSSWAEPQPSYLFSGYYQGFSYDIQ